MILGSPPPLTLALLGCSKSSCLLSDLRSVGCVEVNVCGKVCDCCCYCSIMSAHGETVPLDEGWTLIREKAIDRLE